MDDIIIAITNTYTQLISREELMKYPELNWGQNGVGDRWAKKKYNYSVVYSNKSQKIYSENDEIPITEEAITQFIEKTNNGKKSTGIIGIFVYSKRTNVKSRPINQSIHKVIKMKCCVVCGSTAEIVCDHKNDLYNDERVLNVKTQLVDDFQPLCNHCNLQKRQVCKQEINAQKIYSAKNIPQFKIIPFVFPWEKKVFNVNNIQCKVDTYWHDPVEFNRKIIIYSSQTIPVINSIKHRNFKTL